jgi:20S proteasome subunit beta 5
MNIGNYDVTKMHYEGPGPVPGAPGHGYGYEVRTAGLTSGTAPGSVMQTV